MKEIRVIIFLICNLISSLIIAQYPVQTIKGLVCDRDTKKPLIGATVILQNTGFKTTTDEEGRFRFENVPVGRHILACVFWRYEEYATENIILNAAKLLNLKIELSETIDQHKNESRQHNRPINDMLLVGVRSFTMEEAQRYPPSVNDPARMAMSFAGVRFKDDNDNDLLIRGNSTHGMQYRLEGIEIPNPNHFPRIASTGGGITIMSANLLEKSDFLTAAFSADYGNATAGVFDLHFRDGNNERREHTFRIGIIGMDFATEGPFKKNGASYLINYRFSTLGILNQVGIHMVSSNINNTFQDLSFNIAFPGSKRQAKTSIFGIGGFSAQFTIPKVNPLEQFILQDKFHESYISKIGALGLTHHHSLGDKAYLKIVAAGMVQNIAFVQDTVNPQIDTTTLDNQHFFQARFSLSTYYHKKISKRTTFRTGLYFKHIFYDLKSYLYNKTTIDNDTTINSKGNTPLLQTHAQVRYRFNDQFSSNLGLHFMYFNLNHNYSIEPRFSFSYKIGTDHLLNFGYGLHSKIVPIGNYFVEIKNQEGIKTFPNKNLKLLKSNHFVLGYDWHHKSDWHIRTEIYLQNSYNIPVSADEDSTFWLFNTIAEYATMDLSSFGKGLNYGIDLTLEKFFSKNYFVLGSGSIYRSFFTPLDGITRPSRYDALFNIVLMGGKEFVLKKGGVFQTTLRLNHTGGLRHTPAFEAASIAAQALVLNHQEAYSARAPNYFRIDGRIAYRKDHKGLSYTLALDIQNILNYTNDHDIMYNLVSNSIEFEQQTGLIPILHFRLDF